MNSLNSCVLSLLLILGIPALGKAQTPDAKRLSITKSVMDEFARGAITAVRERFGADLKNSVSENDLKSAREELGTAAGTFRAQISQNTRIVQGATVYVAKSQYERFKVELRLTFDDMDLITGLRISPVSDVSPEHMEASAKAITELLEQKQFDQVSSQFNNQMKAAMSTERLQGSWEHVVAHLGPFKTIKTVRKDPDLDSVDVRCVFEKGPMIVRIAFDPSAKIAGMWMLPAEPETGSQI
jgi:hypothetical protein